MPYPPEFDPAAFKQRTLTQWDEAAQGWNAYAPQIRRWLADATPAMLDAARMGPGMRVLDLAAGAGDQTLSIAERVGREGRVVASDLSPAILVFAADNARLAGFSNVETRVADGETLAVDEGTFDAAICRLGLMLFPDPAAGLAVMYRALRKGGRACTLVFSLPEANGCIATAIRTALEHAGKPPQDPFAPGMLFSLAKPGVIDDAFRRAGFREVATTKIAAPFRMPSARDYVDFVRASAGPIRDLIGRLEPSRADAAWADMESRLNVFETGTGWVGPNELLMTAATR